MGIFNSKISNSSAILPEVEKGNDTFVDPRSPTLNINRSPISPEGVITRATITKMKNLTAELTETDAPTNLQTPCNELPKRFQSIIDPRSPSTFTRTPLVLDPHSPATASNDCSLTTVVSSLEYADNSGPHEGENLDASYKDCESEMPALCNLQIECDDSAPMIEAADGKEDSLFEDAEVVPFVGVDPRSPSIAIARTPMVLVSSGDTETGDDRAEEQVENAAELAAHTKEGTENSQRTPQQGILDSAARGEQTPKKDKLTPASLKAGNRTPLGCVTNTGGLSHIRKMALIGQMKQSIASDEQKLLSRTTGHLGSAELNVAMKNTNRSRIPKFRMS